MIMDTVKIQVRSTQADGFYQVGVNRQKPGTGD